MKANKIKNYVIVFLTMALFATGYSVYKQKQAYQLSYEIFLNHFYHVVDDTIHIIERMIESPDDEEFLQMSFNQLQERLQKADLILYYGNVFVDRDIYYYFYFKNLQYMINGLQSSSNNRSTIYVPPFLEDGKLDEVELTILELHKNDLEKIRTGLYSEERRQENPTISISNFNQVVSPIVFSDLSDMANKYKYYKKKLSTD
ncbi:hypothetical protein AWH56_021205 [Anaerobacillus isosaccharinicus]|uniref:Uncharacterized protein n=1 Tax=Anaerobacillus isosaccharinicus TaxID=1532552 RepID=A0A1S2LHT1_9BACI|nr:hypothetical protein [Anaerobacillus isosaccharinicus]MBA5586572.1 hypothetical protein [Anaerobacillus isosaccharinicus]QOY35192.1 hypothetical protein AWH56_021205 [Anaerobacillus isosaccharinicus]